jgi:hypothetical protein
VLVLEVLVFEVLVFWRDVSERWRDEAPRMPSRFNTFSHWGFYWQSLSD